MDIVHPRVAGIDVHKKVVWVAVRLPGERPGERAVTVKRLLELLMSRAFANMMIGRRASVFTGSPAHMNCPTNA